MFGQSGYSIISTQSDANSTAAVIISDILEMTTTTELLRVCRAVRERERERMAEGCRGIEQISAMCACL